MFRPAWDDIPRLCGACLCGPARNQPEANPEPTASGTKFLVRTGRVSWSRLRRDFTNCLSLAKSGNLVPVILAKHKTQNAHQCFPQTLHAFPVSHNSVVDMQNSRGLTNLKLGFCLSFKGYKVRPNKTIAIFLICLVWQQSAN